MNDARETPQADTPEAETPHVVSWFLGSYVVSLLLLSPFIFLFNFSAVLPFTWATVNATMMARPLSGYGSVSLPTLLACGLLVSIASFCSLLFHMLWPAIFPIWWIGPACTISTMAVIAIAEYFKIVYIRRNE